MSVGIGVVAKPHSLFINSKLSVYSRFLFLCYFWLRDLSKVYTEKLLRIAVFSNLMDYLSEGRPSGCEGRFLVDFLSDKVLPGLESVGIGADVLVIAFLQQPLGFALCFYSVGSY